MRISVYDDLKEMGKAAAILAAEKLNKAISQKGHARMNMSTGKAQFQFLESLIEQDVDWSRVTAFHLDDYIGIPDTHPASFRRFLRERFFSKIDCGKIYYIDADSEHPETVIKTLTEAIRAEPIDVAFIGIGENAHIAFNDPPADFETKEAFIVVALDEACKAQQVGEGWYSSLDEVPKTAITMTAYEIMRASSIISVVPHKVKAKAIYNMLNSAGRDNMIPATLLKEHGDLSLFLDKESASLLSGELLARYTQCGL